MSSFQAALTVVIGLILVASPMLWWVFYRMDAHPAPPHVPREPLKTLLAADVQRIETALGVSLPKDYAHFLQSDRSDEIDNTTVIDDADLIIELTQEYRQGAYGVAPPWPEHFVYVGDEADACPYALNCMSGELIHFHKGSITSQPIARFGSFSEFLAAARGMRPNNSFKPKPLRGSA